MAANDVQIRLLGKDQATPAFKSAAVAAAQTEAQIAALGRATGTLNQIFTSAVGFAAGIAGFNGMTAAVQGTVGAIFNFKKSMEVHETGMAGILMSMTQVDGRTLNWGESLALSKNIMSQLNSEALRTAATTEELTDAFRGILGPALNAKMTINEIIQLSSAGVNAVKSIMPGSADAQRQIVQELRDLVAGGIQPSSSTLATALGLKDSDIKEAKESADGLFVFLMDRLKGFEASAPAYARTWQGISDQLKEGITIAGSAGFDDLFNAAKKELDDLSKKIIFFNEETKKMEVNKDLVATFREISDTVLAASQEVKAIGSDIAVVAVPAAQIFGGALKYAAENAQALTYAIGGWVLLRKVTATVSEIQAVTMGATTAQTLLGRAILSGSGAYRERLIQANATALQERTAVLNTARTIQAAEAEKVVAKKNAATVTAGILKAEQSGNYILASQIRGLAKEYVALGFTAKEAGLMQLQAAQMAQKGQFLLTSQLIATRDAHIASMTAAKASEAAMVTGSARALTAVKTLGAAVFALAGGWWGVAAAAGYALYKMHEAVKAERDAGAEIEIDEYGQMQVKYTEKYTEKYNEKEREKTSNLRALKDDRDLSEAELEQERLKLELSKIEGLQNQISAKYPTMPDIPSAKAASSAAKSLERAYEEKQRLLDKIADMTVKIDTAINEDMFTAFESSAAKIASEADNMRRELDKSKIDFEKYGIDVSTVYEKIGKYQDAMTARAERQRLQAARAMQAETAAFMAGITGDPIAIARAEYRIEITRIKQEREEDTYFKKIAKGPDDAEARAIANEHYAAKLAAAQQKLDEAIQQGYAQRHEWAVKYNNNLLTLGLTTAQKMDELNRREIDNEILRLNESLGNAEEYSREYYEIYDKLAQATQQRNEIMSRNMVDAIGIAIEDIKNQQINFADMYKETWENIDSGVNSHFKSILQGNENLANGIKGTILDISNAITAMFADILYQTYIMQPVKNWFTGLLGSMSGGIGGSAVVSVNSGNWNVGAGLQFSSIGSIPTPKYFAKGGIADGWSVVGEEGPELVHFSNPTRVYDAQKTKIMTEGKQERQQPPINVYITVQTQDLQSFRRSQTQFMAEVGRAISTATGRNL